MILSTYAKHFSESFIFDSIFLQLDISRVSLDPNMDVAHC